MGLSEITTFYNRLSCTNSWVILQWNIWTLEQKINKNTHSTVKTFDIYSTFMWSFLFRIIFYECFFENVGIFMLFMSQLKIISDFYSLLLSTTSTSLISPVVFSFCYVLGHHLLHTFWLTFLCNYPPLLKAAKTLKRALWPESSL